MQMILLVICYVHLVAGLHIQARGGLINIDDGSSVARKACRCARFRLIV